MLRRIISLVRATSHRARTRACAAALVVAPSVTAHAQSNPKPFDSTHVDKTFFTRRDAALSGIAIVGSAGLSVFDKRIAHWFQSPRVQGDSIRHDHVDALTRINETPLTIGAVLTYGIGRLTGSETVTDIGLHTSEALVLTDVISETIRGPIGRARPRVSEDDQYNFKFWAGFTKFENRSFPSLHSASAFAAAASLVGEIHERNPSATKYAAPLLYAAASVPGLTRMYLNQHWASDIVSGAFVGTLLGAKVVHYAHSHRRSKLDRVLMGSTLMPNGQGGVLAAVSIAP
jgi:membrane-associated phospholipid phosphatase